MSSEGLPRLTLEAAPRFEASAALAQEWLLGNGLGGYASGTVAGCNTRKYHGLLVASLPGRGRTLLLARLGERVHLPGHEDVTLDGFESAETGLSLPGLAHLERFELEGQLPTWHFSLLGCELRRRHVLIHGEDTLYVTYELLSGPEVTLTLRPFAAFRSHDGPLVLNPEPLVSSHLTDGLEVRAPAETVALRMRITGAKGHFDASGENLGPLVYRTERSRGYEALERLWSPGAFTFNLKVGQVAAFAATTGGFASLSRAPSEVLEGEWQRERALLERAPAVARTGTAARLVLAADPFIMAPMRRTLDEGGAGTAGAPSCSVIAGYPWFTDWGRDTMISLEGLALATGQTREAASILRTFHHYVRDGLLPNYFPEGEADGVYHTADATLWYFHALSRYLAATDDTALLREIFPALADIVARHLAGTRFNIHVDPADGLLVQGAPGYQLTWMDAKVEGWVVTPRRGKAVELNALWFNALRLMADWCGVMGEDPVRYVTAAARTEQSFNRRFWNPAQGCLFDVVDVLDAAPGSDDAAVRPNQVFALSLQHPVLARERWEAVLSKVAGELLTPVGLRTLSPASADYRARYDGDLRSRDAAYHQGTVWPWLLGHYVDAVLKHSGDRTAARRLLVGLEEHLRHACLGQISEIFDASAPYRARGCFAQAWSVAELLRAWVKTDANSGQLHQVPGPAK